MWSFSNWKNICDPNNRYSHLNNRVKPFRRKHFFTIVTSWTTQPLIRSTFVFRHDIFMFFNALHLSGTSEIWQHFAIPFRIPIIDSQLYTFSIDLSRNDVTTFSNFSPISLVQNGVQVWILHEKIDKYRKYLINSNFRGGSYWQLKLNFIIKFSSKRGGDMVCKKLWRISPWL